MKPSSTAQPWAHLLQADGYATVTGLYSEAEVAALLACVKNTMGEETDSSAPPEVFAIRSLFEAVPELWNLVKTPALQTALAQVFPNRCHLVKAMYFDKPSLLNWRVAWHQDLMINVDHRTGLPGFGPWTRKVEGVSVQPPVAILEALCTVRIHLDDCDAGNGALQVAPGSHRLGVLQPAALAPLLPAAVICPVPAGGAMLMRPLLLHASSRNGGDRPRRVLHLEFAEAELPGGLQWRERRQLY